METPEQLADRNARMPKGVKKDKAVRRELCSVLTKGVAFHRDEAATYLLCVTEDQASGLLGVCFVDAATGKFFIGQCAEDAQKNRLRTLLAQLRPSEILLDANAVSHDTYVLQTSPFPLFLWTSHATPPPPPPPLNCARVRVLSPLSSSSPSP